MFALITAKGAIRAAAVMDLIGILDIGDEFDFYDIRSDNAQDLMDKVPGLTVGDIVRLETYEIVDMHKVKELVGV